MGRTVKAWALWSARVDMYSEPELIEVFTCRADADAVRDALVGKQRDAISRLFGVWGDDEDFPDLYVRPIEIR
jgi:hypothetical protein